MAARKHVASSAKALLILALIAGLLAASPAQLAAQSSDVLCGLFGSCAAPPSTGQLLGLPNGTLVVEGSQPWDQVVKGSAAAAWAPLEAEARAFLSAMQGVANDNRLPHNAADELRALIFARLLDIADRDSKGQTLSDVEQAALKTFKDAIIARRVMAPTLALNEYYKWAASPCSYVVPAGFGFDPYDAGPACAAGVPTLAGNPRPPTEQQFTAYGAALANSDFSNADAQAAFLRMDQSIAVAGGIAGGLLTGGVAAIFAATIPAVATTFAYLAGSSLFSTAAVAAAGVAGGMSTAATGSLSAGFSTMLATTGVGIGASLPAIIIIATVVTVIGTIEIVEDSQILPDLQNAVDSARETPDIPGMTQDLAKMTLLESVFVAQTLPDYTSQRLAAPDTPAPTAWSTGNPVFTVNGVDQQVLDVISDGLERQVFMSDGWFVTRTFQSATNSWGPWNWALSFKYNVGGNSNQPKVIAIQPGGFLDVDYLHNTSSKTMEFQPALADFSVATVVWKGNHAPVINPTASTNPTIGAPVAFSAGATDPDGDTMKIKWFIEDPSFQPLFSDFAQCGFAPPETIVPAGGGAPLPVVCPWREVDDPGSGITYTFPNVGTFRVKVAVQDANLAVTTQQFVVVIGNVAPTVTITAPPAQAAVEGQPVTVAGTLSYPAFSGDQYSSRLRMVVDWGDGNTSEFGYPCAVDSIPLSVEGVCTEINPFAGPAGAGPWNFSFSHMYVYTPSQGVPSPAPINVYAQTVDRDHLSSAVSTFLVNVSNMTPIFVPDQVCSGFFCSAGSDVRSGGPGDTITVGGGIEDAPGSKHGIQIFWGDGSLSFMAPGCTDPGCPTPLVFNSASNDQQEIFLAKHAYQSGGVFPISMVLFDGGPNGQVAYAAQATIFGVGSLQGPTQVVPGTPATYTFATTVPTGSSIALAPSCGPGTVTASTATSFTCSFPDVPAATGATVAISGTLGTSLSTQSLGVTIAPRPVSISTFQGPTSVTAGQPVTYTYTVVQSPYVGVQIVPSCMHGSITAATTGSSFTCVFQDTGTAYASQVGVVVIDTNLSHAQVTQYVSVTSDLTPPVLTLPSTMRVNSTSNAGAIVSYAVSANDAVSGPAPVTCRPLSNTQFPIGTTTISCSAADWKGNTATGSFTVTVVDVTPPTLTLPAPVTVDATSPAGAVVKFTASAVDFAPAAPAVSCLPGSGSVFPIGQTTVMCRAADTAGNVAAGHFTVTVNGAAAELNELAALINSFPISSTLKTSLLSRVATATSFVSANNKVGACGTVASLISTTQQLEASKQLTVAEANAMFAMLSRIQAVLGC